MDVDALRMPVVLLVFNRPECTARVFEKVRHAKPARLWVVADGPRADRPDDTEQIAAVRRLVEMGIDWQCDLRRVYSNNNLGCARRVSSGLHTVFGEEESAIILEDDCLPDSTFFRFASELLEYYRNDERIAVVSGDNFQLGRAVSANSYYFSRYPHCWGWATWRRAWKDYDHTMADWPERRDTDWLDGYTTSAAEKRYWRYAFDATRAGTLDSWANRWTLSCWIHNRLAALPAANLVSNIGFGPAGTHTHTSGPVAALPVEPMTFPLRHPTSVSRLTSADARTARTVFHRANAPRRIFNKVRHLLGSRPTVLR